MTKLIDTDRAAVNELKKALGKIPELAHLVPHVAGGLKVLHYMFAAIEAAETVKPPRGIALGGLDVRVKKRDDPKAIGAITVAGWMIDRLSERLQIKSEDV